MTAFVNRWPMPLGRILVGTAAVWVALVGWAPAALAHTAFESSDPADVAEIDKPIEMITVVFTGAAEPAGEGFQVLTPAGVVVVPEVEVGDDQRTFTLTLAEPLVDGTVGVRWSVRAGDAHPIEGSFSFTTTAVRPPPAAEPTAAPSPTPTAAVSDDADDAGTNRSESEAVATSSPIATPTVTEREVVDQLDNETDSADAGSVAAATPADLDSFLGGDDDKASSVADVIGYLGRALTIVAAMVAVGTSALVLALARPTLDVLRSHRWVAVVALAVVAGAVVEAFAFALDDAGGVLRGQAGLAIGLRMVGGAAIAAGWMRRVRLLSLVGAAAVLGSFLFDGHTVTEGNRILTGIAGVVHAGAGAVWIAGVTILVILARSKRSSDRLPAFAVRFSVIATLAIAAVGIAGIALTVTIIDAFSDLWTTSWGRMLIAKTVFVASALAIGAYNHFTLVPAIERSDPRAIERFGRVVRIELAVLVVVAALTAALVAGAT